MHWFHQRKCVLCFLNESVRFNTTPKVVTLDRDCHNILLLHRRAGIKSRGRTYLRISGEWETICLEGSVSGFREQPELQKLDYSSLPTATTLLTTICAVVHDWALQCTQGSDNRTELFPSLDWASLANPPGSSTERISKLKNI